MRKIVTIEKRFCGPPDSANGGYAAGIIAESLLAMEEPGDRAIDVRLRMPPPLERELICQTDSDRSELIDGSDLLLSGSYIKEPLVEIPDLPTYEEAVEYSKNYSGFNFHFFPTCFVCGPKRKEEDALRIFCGSSPDQSVVAGPWIPSDDLAEADQSNPERKIIPPRYVAASLDCAGAFAAMKRPTQLVLARMTLWFLGNIKPGERCVVIGWPIQLRPKNPLVGTAVFNEDGICCGVARSLWLISSRWDDKMYAGDLNSLV